MPKIDVTGGITEVTARQNVRLTLKSTFLKADETAADISSFDVAVRISDGFANSQNSALLHTLTETPVDGDYFIRDDVEASVTAIIGAETSKALKAGKEYLVEIYLLEGTEPIKSALWKVTFTPGGKI